MLEEIGEKAYNFALFFSILFTVFGLIMIASGISIPSEFSSLFLPMSFFYGSAESIVSSLSSATLSNPISAALFLVNITAVVIGVILNILFLIVTVFLQLILVMYNILPPEISFLVLPLAFIASFIQVAVWVFFAKKLAEMVPFIRITI